MTENVERRLKELRRINRSFCRDALSHRWQFTKGGFTNTNPAESDYWEINERWAWLRSIDCRKKNMFMFTMDFDSDKLGTNILNSVKKSAKVLEDITGKPGMLKASGSSGAHVYQKIIFPHNYTVQHCMTLMKDLAYTVYKKGHLKKRRLLIGPYKKAELSPWESGFIDTRVFKHNGMVRAFSIHPTTMLYSVPIFEDDSINDVQERMRLETKIPFVEVAVVKYSPKWDLEKYVEKDVFERNPINLDLKAMEKLVDRARGDRYYKLLPDTLKGVACMDGDPHHDLKVALVHHLHYYYLMTAEEIRAWLNDNVKWNDFDVNSQQTQYQCYDAVHRIEKYKYPSHYIPLEPDTIPLKREYYGSEE